MLNQFDFFDSHFHIIEGEYPRVANDGYLPDEFTCDDYLRRTAAYKLCGGALVSGSFQGFDQTYLIAALAKMGPSFVGVTQLPFRVSADEIRRLHNAGVRAVRFNLKRGGSEDIIHLQAMAERIYELVGWHVELYVDAGELSALYNILVALPAVSIDHLGLSQSGLAVLAKLAEKGVKVKATGFGRVDFDIKRALRDLYSANPQALMFGTDLPSTRSPRPYSDQDFVAVVEALGVAGAREVFAANAIDFYRVG